MPYGYSQLGGDIPEIKKMFSVTTWLFIALTALLLLFHLCKRNHTRAPTWYLVGFLVLSLLNLWMWSLAGPKSLDYLLFFWIFVLWYCLLIKFQADYCFTLARAHQ